MNWSIYRLTLSYYKYNSSCSDDPEFTELIREAELAVDNGVYPQRIYQVNRNKSPEDRIITYLWLCRALVGATLWKIEKAWRSECSSRKMRNPTGGSTPSGPSGCIACAVPAVLEGLLAQDWSLPPSILINQLQEGFNWSFLPGPAWSQTKATCPRPAPASSTPSSTSTSCLKRRWVVAHTYICSPNFRVSREWTIATQHKMKVYLVISTSKIGWEMMRHVKTLGGHNPLKKVTLS